MRKDVIKLCLKINIVCDYCYAKFGSTKYHNYAHNIMKLYDLLTICEEEENNFLEFVEIELGEFWKDNAVEKFYELNNELYIKTGLRLI